MNEISRLGKNKSGFTLIEIIAVLIIVGILLAVAVSKLVSTQNYSVAAEVDIMKMNIRYAQFRALSDDKSWGMSFTSNSYTILRDGSIAPYNLQNEDSSTHNLPGGITISGDTVTFDEWGSPGTNDIQLTMSPGPVTITITKNTGFIP